MLCRISRFVGKLAGVLGSHNFILKLQKKERQEETEEERGTLIPEGGVRVCGIAVLGYFWCGFAVIFFSKHGNAVFKVQAVRGNFKFYVAVIGEKIVVSR